VQIAGGVTVVVHTLVLATTPHDAPCIVPPVHTEDVDFLVVHNAVVDSPVVHTFVLATTPHDAPCMVPPPPPAIVLPDVPVVVLPVVLPPVIVPLGIPTTPPPVEVFVVFVDAVTTPVVPAVLAADTTPPDLLALPPAEAPAMDAPDLAVVVVVEAAPPPLVALPPPTAPPGNAPVAFANPPSNASSGGFNKECIFMLPFFL